MREIHYDLGRLFALYTARLPTIEAKEVPQ